MNSEQPDFEFIFVIFATVSTLVHLFSSWLDFRQLKVYRSSQFTDEIQNLFDVNETKFNEAKSYAMEKMIFSMIFEWIEFVFKLHFIYFKTYEMGFRWVQEHVSLPFYFQASTLTILITLFTFITLGLFKSWYSQFYFSNRTNLYH